MFCFQDQKNNRYLCSTEIKRMDPSSFIKITPNFINTHIPPPTFSNKEYQPDITSTQIAFAFFSTYLLFPLTYFIFSTGNIYPIIFVWNFIKTGILNTVHAVNEFLTDVVYTTLRMFGQYTFSTYTVVKNGREVYSASSMCFFKHSSIDSVYRVDRAKYNLCKWIDRQCEQYRLQNHGEEPELTDKHNDIYDFIVHKVDNQPFIRIHRGDFSGRTHTFINQHYRPFKKGYQIANGAKLTVCLPNDNNEESTPETFSISLKHPYNFLLEKNEILDKKFLQWKIYTDYGRADVANYIGQPFSKYTLTLSYHDRMKPYLNEFSSKALSAMKEATAEAEATAETTADTAVTPDETNEEEQNSVIFYINDSHSMIVGTRYVVKVDSLLRCPVFESNDSQVYDLDNMLTNYYVCSDSDTDATTDSDSDYDSDEDDESVDNSDNDDDNDAENRTPTKKSDGSTTLPDDPEFEVIDQQTQ